MKTSRRKLDLQANPLVVLLVETSEDYAALFTRRIAKVARHWQVIKVSDGQRAVQHMIHNGFPALFVTCLQTPRLSAVDVVEWIRTMKSPAPVPVLIYDDSPPALLRTRLSELGGIDYLDKHAPEEKLRQVLAYLIEKIERSNFKVSVP